LKLVKWTLSRYQIGPISAIEEPINTMEAGVISAALQHGDLMAGRSGFT
jgi:hypothetical protein